MFCLTCGKRAELVCCSNFYFCNPHLNQHLNIEGHHNPQRLLFKLDPFKQSTLNTELINRISILKQLKSSLISSTKSLLLTITSLQNSITAKINQEIKSYVNILYSKFSTNPENLDFILKTDIIVQEEPANSLIESIKLFYSSRFLFINTLI